MVWAASLDDKKGSSAKSLSSVTGRAALSLRAVSRSNDPITACQMSECGKGNKYETSMKVRLQHETDHTYEVVQTELRPWSKETIRRKVLLYPEGEVELLLVGIPGSSGNIVVQQITHPLVSGEAPLHCVGTLNVRMMR